METEEIWRDIPGYEEVYQVSNLGNVRSLGMWAASRWGCLRWVKGRVLVPDLGKDGYFRVTLYVDGKRKTAKVASLVAAAFIGPRPIGYEVCHNDGDRTNNMVANLRYDTPSGNNQDKVAHGTATRGEKSVNAKLTEAQVLEIRSLRGIETGVSLAKRFGVCQAQVGRIQRRQQWSHI